MTEDNNPERIDVTPGGAPNTETETSTSGDPSSPAEIPTVEGEEDPDLDVPLALYETPPEDLTLSDLDPLDPESRENMIQSHPHFKAEIREKVTGDAEQKPTAKELKEAYLEDEITTVEMEALRDEATVSQASEGSEDDQSPSVEEKSTEESTTADESKEDDTPEPRTLKETGAVNEDNEFLWEEDEGEVISSNSELGEQQTHRRVYKGVPFEFHEPEDQQQYENRLGILEGIQDDPSDRQKKKAEKYAKRLAYDNITVDGQPLEEVYQVESSDGRKKIVSQSDYPEHDLESIEAATPVWEAMNWFDQMMFGRKMSDLIQGDGKFRSLGR